MSLGGLIDWAVVRGKETPNRRNRYATEAEPGEKPATPAALGVLLTVIPVELVTLYTAFVTGTSSRFTPSDSFLTKYKSDHDGAAYPFTYNRDLGVLRWAVFAVCAVAAIGVVFQGWRTKKQATDKRKFPISEASAGAFAFSVWGLVMPAGLLGSYVKTEDLDVYTLGISLVGAVALLALGIGVLKQKAQNTL